MTGLGDLLRAHVADGSVAGAVALVARGNEIDVQAAGWHDLERGTPMTRDTIFRIASITKPILAAVTLLLVQDGRLALEDPVRQWLPELAEPMVLRRPDAPVEDVTPAVRPITVRHLLESRAGYGFPSDFSCPVVQLIRYLQPGPRPHLYSAPDAWLARLAGVPLLHQPGESWSYNTSFDILGVLLARVAGCPLPQLLAELVFEPLGMPDTAFWVPPGKQHRFASHYRPGPDGALWPVGEPDGAWRTPPAFPSGAGGLVSTVDDWFAFARMLLGAGRQLLAPESVRLLMTDHLTAAQREAGRLFLEGQGWGYGGSVDVAAREAWNVPGRYGWVGATGTAAHVVPATGGVTILLTQREMTGPGSPPTMREFWRYAAG